MEKNKMTLSDIFLSDHKNFLNNFIKILFMVFIILFIRYSIILLTRFEFGDEAETIVACRMMASGKKLYKEIFNHHGPLTFLPGYLVEIIFRNILNSSNTNMFHRIPMMILQLISLCSVYFSPILKNRIQKIFSVVIIAFIMTIYLSRPPIFGNLYLYQAVAGNFIFFILVQLIFPFFLQIKINNKIKIISILLIYSLPFLAITYLPTAILLLCCIIDKDNWKSFIKIGIFFLALLIIYLLLFGSIKGYLAYHIYLNLKILAPQSGLLWYIKQSYYNIFSNIYNFYFMIYLIIVTFLLVQHNHKNSIILNFRALFIVLISLSLVVRGNDGLIFHSLPYYYFLLACFPIAIQMVKIEKSKIFIILIMLLTICKISLFLPGERLVLGGKYTKKTFFSDLTKKITNKDDKILALTFQNQQYIAAERNPASAHFFYLPWQAYYNKNPKLGIYTNLAEDIIKNKPKIIMADKWKVWDVEDYSWDKYALDVDNVIKENYYKLQSGPYYIRKDIDLSNYGLDKATGMTFDELYATDDNWIHAISRSAPIFYVLNTEENNKKYLIGKMVKFEDGSKREIVNVKEAGMYLHIHVKGQLLDANKVGIPGNFKVE